MCRLQKKDFVMGRHSEYDEDIAQEICEAIADHPMMLEELCEKFPHWPSAHTIYKWRRKYPVFAQKYTEAKQDQIDVLVSNMFRIARDRSKDYILDAEGKMHFNPVYSSMARCEIDAIKWYASKLAPKIYGERVEKSSPEAQSLLQNLIDKL